MSQNKSPGLKFASQAFGSNYESLLFIAMHVAKSHTDEIYTAYTVVAVLTFNSYSFKVDDFYSFKRTYSVCHFLVIRPRRPNLGRISHSF